MLDPIARSEDARDLYVVGGANGWAATALTLLPRGTILDEKALAAALDVSTRTIRRMVDRGELPPGVRLGARKVWFSEKVLDFIAERAERVNAAEERHRAAMRGRF